MITKIDSVQTKLPDHTGNSAIVEIGSNLYIVGNVKVDGNFSIYKSTDAGKTWTIPATHSLQAGTSKFDPAIKVVGSVIHIIGAVANSSDAKKYDLVKFKFDTGSSTLSGPVTIASGSELNSGYDIEILGSGVQIVAVALWNADSFPNYSLVAFELDSSDIITQSTILVTTDIRSGNTYGSVSLLSLDGTACDLYYSSHVKNIYLVDKQISIKKRSRIGAGTWGSESNITTYLARYTDNKLTVMKYGTSDVLVTQSYYTVTLAGAMIYSSIIGYYNATAGQWRFTGIYGDDSNGFGQGTISIDQANNVYFSVIQFPVSSGKQSSAGALKCYQMDLSTLVFTEFVGNFNTLSLSCLRGSEVAGDNQAKWLLLGYTTLGDALFVSDKNLPPVIVVNPTSANIIRGQSILLDASQSFDPDLDPMTFTWSNDDVTGQFNMSSTSWSQIAVVANKAIGPDTRVITVGLSVSDGINSPVTTTIPLTLAVNDAPVIDMGTDPLDVTRNAVTTLTPTVTDPENDPLTYQWIQQSGSIISTSSLTNKDLTIYPYRTNPAGETLTFSLTVSDGINTPVSATIDLNISALDSGFSDTRILKTSSIASKQINLRNTESNWSVLNIPSPSVTSDFKDYRTNRTSSGETRCCFISDKSMVVTDSLIGTENSYFRKRITYKGIILDGLHTEDDSSFLLVYDSVADKDLLMRFISDGYFNVSDYPDQELDLSTITGFKFSKMYATDSINGKRIFLFAGDDGILLVQIDNNDVRLVQQNIFISTASNTLFGANSIQFVRFIDLESTNSGRILIGSKDNLGNYFETLLDLSVKRIIGTWDKNVLISDRINTGEFLFHFNNGSTTGLPATPVLNSVTSAEEIVNISWQEIRSDIVDYYELEMSIDNGPFSLFQRLNSGAITSTSSDALDISSHLYTFRVRAGNEDGLSGYSNEESIGSLPSPGGGGDFFLHINAYGGV